METAVFLGLNALGDTLCTTPVLRAFRRAHPHVRMAYVVHAAPYCHILDGNPDVDVLIYHEGLLHRGLDICDNAWVHSLPLDLSGGGALYRLDLHAACTTAATFHAHISHAFARLLSIPLDSVRPVIVLHEQDRRHARACTRGPYALLSMHSRANPPRPDGRGKVKDWPLDRWTTLAGTLRAAGLEVLCIGSEADERYPIPGTRHLYGLPIRTVAALIDEAAVFVTLENGLAHMAAAVDAPTVLLYSNIVPLVWARPAESTRCQIVYGDPFDASVDTVWSLVERTLAERRACA